MTTNDRIKILLVQNNVSKAKLEKDLNFANGSLFKNDDIKSDRLLKIARYFNVTTDYLLGNTVEDVKSPDQIAYDPETHTWNTAPEYDVIEMVMSDDEMSEKLLTYAKKLLELKKMEEE